ncbi:MAG: imidazole glycerol phosphate synthase subunit HisH [Blastocatellia bacterium]|nr:imidazole glycerol phosphate synthase subunit HisH [Blastocatellia bacterium]
MKVAIIKYRAGNVRSVANAFARLGVEAVITDDAAELAAAERVVFPGVGEASTAMAYLREKGLDKTIAALTQPVLGICLGMQLLCESSDENDAKCLGILPHRVRRFAASPGLKVPHMGWSRITRTRSQLFEGVPDAAFMYFVHGYHLEPGEHTTAEAEHGSTFSAAVEFRNFYAVQFHPERSGAAGSRVLQNFLNI